MKPKLIFFLDYDGTLTPIVDKPSLAVLSKSRRKTLRQLAKTPQVLLAIVSGRELADVKKLVGIPNLIYAGNHGFEIKGPRINTTLPQAKKTIPVMKKIKKALMQELRAIKGVIVEDKTLTLSIHYRLAKEKDEAMIKKIVRQATKSSKKVKVTFGKKVIEIRPNFKWDKGAAVLWLLKKLGQGRKVVPVYIGDDQTDEDAFRALKNKGITVRVGRAEKTLARHRVKDVNEVYKFIQSMLKLE
ncbi:MAG: trehalose-phosphatase [bacterium]